MQHSKHFDFTFQFSIKEKISRIPASWEKANTDKARSTEPGANS